MIKVLFPSNCNFTDVSSCCSASIHHKPVECRREIHTVTVVMDGTGPEHPSTDVQCDCMHHQYLEWRENSFYLFYVPCENILKASTIFYMYICFWYSWWKKNQRAMVFVFLFFFSKWSRTFNEIREFSESNNSFQFFAINTKLPEMAMLASKDFTTGFYIRWYKIKKEIVNISLLAIVDISAVQSSAQTFIHNAILIPDTSKNAWHSQAHWLIRTP